MKLTEKNMELEHELEDTKEDLDNKNNLIEKHAQTLQTHDD